MNFVEESTLMLKKLKSPIEKDLYAKYLSDLTNISVDSIRASIGIKVSRNYNNKNNAKHTNVHRKIEQMSKIQDGYLKVETNFIKLLMENKELRNSVISDIKSDEFSIDETKEIFNYIIKNKELDKITIDKIKSLNISEEYIKGLESISLDNLDLNNIKNIDEIIKNIRKNSLNEKINMLLKEQIDIEKNKDVKDVKEVDSKIMEIALKIVELRRQLQRL